MIKSLNSLRFVFAFMIFLHHFSIGGSSVFREGGNLSVTFFFILSGFVLAYSYGDNIFRKQVSYKEFIYKRINRLFPLHIFGFVIALILYVSLAFVGKSLSTRYLLVGGVNVLLLQSWIPIKSIYFSYNAVSWCLSDQLFFYLMFPFLIRIMMNKSLKNVSCLLLPLVISYILIMVFLPASYVHQFFYINPLFRITDFIIGIFLFLLYDKKIKHIKLNNQLSTIFEILSVVVIAVFVIVLKVYPDIVLYSIFYWIPIGLVLLMFVYSEQILGGGVLTKLLSNKIFLYLGSVSFSFFIMHQLVIRAVSMLSSYFGIEVHNVTGLIVTFLLALLASMFCYHYIEKPASNKLNKKLLV